MRISAIHGSASHGRVVLKAVWIGRSAVQPRGHSACVAGRPAVHGQARLAKLGNSAVPRRPRDSSASEVADTAAALADKEEDRIAAPPRPSTAE